MNYLNPDPLAEQYANITPYSYCSGDPVNLVDLSGLYPHHITSGLPGQAAAMQDGGGGSGEGWNGSGADGYYYDWYSGTYRTTDGSIVSFGEVMDNAITPHGYTYSTTSEYHYSAIGSMDASGLFYNWKVTNEWYSYSTKLISSPTGQIRNGGSYFESLNWSEIASATGGLILSGIEIGAGIGGEMFTGGLSNFAVVDGVTRAGSSLTKLYFLFNGNSARGIATPSNLGGWAGKALDIVNGSSYDEISYGQGIGSFSYDAGTFIMFGANAQNLNKALTYPTAGSIITYGAVLTGVPYTTSSDAISFYISIKH